MDVFFDGHFVYVLNIQQTIQSNPTPSYYVSIVVLDRNGNTITSQTRIETSAFSYQLGNLLPCYSGGAWYTQRHQPGFTKVPTITKVDSLGRDILVVSGRFGSVSEIKSFITLKDSTYLVAANNYSATGGMTPPTSALMKFDSNGNITWAYHYEIPITGYLEFKTCVEDDNGNIYSIGSYYTPTSINVIFGLKVDSNGTPIIFRTWNSLDGYSNHKLSYRNGEIYDLFSGKEIHFDSLFQDSCLISVIDPVTFTPTGTYPLASGTSNLSSFTPSDTTLTLPNFTYPDYCTVLLKTDEIESDKVLIYPNPTHDKIQIFSDNIPNHPEEINIYDITGRKVYSNFNSLIESIDVSQFSNGLYYLKIKSANFVQSGKFVKL